MLFENHFIECKKNLYYAGSCRHGDVWLQKEGGTPYIFWLKEWFPICGHWFWDDNNGATAFCNKLGYPSGTQARTFQSYDEESMKVGGCYPGEDLIDCTAGGNEYKIGGSCTPGNDEGISISCSGQAEQYSSCLDKGNIFDIH